MWTRRIVSTVGSASEAPQTLEQLVNAMDAARLLRGEDREVDT